jgi:DNA-binding transcriptional ArsR family regulator
LGLRPSLILIWEPGHAYVIPRLAGPALRQSQNYSCIDYYVTMTDPGELRLSDVSTMKALAHPLRLRILGSLRQDGPATSATLARSLGADTGRTSFHLRQLAKAGLVQDLPEMGKGRERWWKASSEPITWDPLALLQDAGTESALLGFEEAAVRTWMGALGEYVRTRREWSAAWNDAASSADYQIRLRPADLKHLLTELRDAIQRHDLGSAAPPGAAPVTVQLHAFPRRLRS